MCLNVVYQMKGHTDSQGRTGTEIQPGTLRWRGLLREYPWCTSRRIFAVILILKVFLWYKENQIMLKTFKKF